MSDVDSVIIMLLAVSLSALAYAAWLRWRK
jgi:hypothetical protein